MTRLLHVDSWGAADAPRVVCLHGVTGQGSLFGRLATTRLADRHVLAPDLVGHGSSPYEPPWTIAEQVETLVATLCGATGAAGAVEPWSWVGHSFGGRVAFELAAAHPGLVGRLVLLDPAMHLDPAIALHVAEASRDDRSYASFEEAVERRFEESFLSRASRDVVAADLAAALAEDEDGRWRYRYSQAAVVASFGEMAAPPPPFASVRVPTLLVLGEDSYLGYDHLLEAHRAALGDLLRVVTVPGGHTVLWDALDETAEAVGSFLRE